MDRYGLNTIDLRYACTKAQEHARFRRMEAMRQNEALTRALAPQPYVPPAGAGKAPITPMLTRMMSIVLVVASAWLYLPTVASSLSYFWDTEGSDSLMASGLLDLEVTDPEAEIVSCGGISSATTSITTAVSGFPALVAASTTGLSGNVALCEALELDVRYDHTTIYSGPLDGFTADGLEDGDLRYLVSLPDGAGPFPEDASCTIHILYTAYLESADSPEESGFTDTEETQVTFMVDIESCESCKEPCDTCGDLYVDVENTNNATVINEFIIVTNTGDNEATGSSTTETGDASSTVSIFNEVNTSSTTIDATCECCGCEDACDTELCAESREEEETASSSEEMIVIEEEEEGLDDSTLAEDLMTDIEQQLNDRLRELLR